MCQDGTLYTTCARSIPAAAFLLLHSVRYISYKHFLTLRLRYSALTSETVQNFGAHESVGHPKLELLCPIKHHAAASGTPP